MVKKRINVAMVASFPPPYGGISNWVLTVEKYAKENGVVFIPINTAPVSRGLDGRTLYDRVVRQGIIMLQKRKELADHIQKGNIDVVHIATSGQLAAIRDIMMISLAKKKGIKTVYHLHFGRIPEIEQENTREWKLIKKAITLADHVIAIDQATLSTVQKYVPENHASFVPNPFDLEKIRVSPAPSKNLREISYVGWVVKTKGIDELLQAWEKIQSNYPDYTLNIVGPCKDDYQSEIEQAYNTRNVRFCGEVSNPEALEIINRSRVFVLPSYTEGFPNVVLEAMALKTPVIATAVGATPEILSDNCGILIEPKDVVAIEDAVRYAIENQDKMIQQAENAYLKLLHQYEISVVFEQYRKVWGGKQ